MTASKQGIINRILGRTGVTTKLDYLQADSVLSPDVSADNYLINGGFDFWQRGQGPHTCTTSKKYSADRWCIFDGDNGQSYVIATSSVSINTQYGLKIVRNTGQTGTGTKSISQTLELKNTIPLSGKTVTLSFYVKAGANFSGTILAKIAQGTGTGDASEVIFNGFTSQTNSNKTFVPTTLFQKITHTVVLNSGTKQLGIAIEWTPSGTAGADDTVTFEQIILNIGSQPAQFVRAGKSIGGELALCQRYYYRPSDSDVSGADAVAVGQCWNSTQAGVIVPFPVAMRTVPVPYSSGMALTGASSSVIPITGLTDWNSTKFTGSLNCTVASGLVAGNATLLQRNGTNVGYYVDFSAEI